MASPSLQSSGHRLPSGTASSKPARKSSVTTAVFVALPDGRGVNVECCPGDGAPLVLLHGLLDCAAGRKHLAELTDRPCYAVDLPGFGDSDCPTQPHLGLRAGRPRRIGGARGSRLHARRPFARGRCRHRAGRTSS